MARSIILAAVLAACGACTSAPGSPNPAQHVPMTGPLISAKATITTAWLFPRNPLTDKTLDDSKLSQEIRAGFRIFTDTPKEAPNFAPGKMSCNNCHMNGGQRERSLPLVNVAGMFPEYNRRSGRLFTLGDRIVDCFLRSEAAASVPTPSAATTPTPTSKEVLAVAAYLTWLAKGAEIGKNPPWRGQNTIPQEHLTPVGQIDPGRGQEIYQMKCQSCHGFEGQGVAIGDKKPAPLWGPDSWNDGAGAARVYTLAGIVRYSMPYLDPGSLTDEEALAVAAFIDSKPRPDYPFKDADYLSDKLPADAVYYESRVEAPHHGASEAQHHN